MYGLPRIFINIKYICWDTYIAKMKMYYVQAGKDKYTNCSPTWFSNAPRT